MTLSAQHAPASSAHLRTFAALGTRVSLVLTQCEAQEAEAHLTWAQNAVRDWEAMLSRFNPHSAVSRLNASAGLAPFTPEPPFWDLLCACKDYWRRTEGAFDIALLPLYQLWKHSHATGIPPSSSALAQAQKRSGLALLEVDERDAQVRLTQPGAGIDLGGIGKGFIADQLAFGLRQRGQSSALLCLGDSTLYGLGNHPGGAPWPTCLASLPGLAPEDCEFPLSNSGFSCSKTAAWQQGQFDSLTISPFSGLPVPGSRLSAVSCLTAMDAEVLSSALLLCAPDSHSQLLTNFKAQRSLELAWEGSAHSQVKILSSTSALVS